MPCPRKGSMNAAASPTLMMPLRTGSGGAKKTGAVVISSVAGVQESARCASGVEAEITCEIFVAAEAFTNAQTFTELSLMG